LVAKQLRGAPNTRCNKHTEIREDLFLIFEERTFWLKI